MVHTIFQGVIQVIKHAGCTAGFVFLEIWQRTARWYDMKSIIWICFNGRSGDCGNLDSLDDQKLQASSGLLWMNDV